jgi:hypothetical protein
MSAEDLGILLRVFQIDHKTMAKTKFFKLQSLPHSGSQTPTPRNYLIRDAIILSRIVKNSSQISVRDDFSFRGGMSVID